MKNTISEKFFEGTNKIKTLVNSIAVAGAGIAAITIVGCASIPTQDNDEEATINAFNEFSAEIEAQQQQVAMDDYCNTYPDECECEDTFKHEADASKIRYAGCRLKTEDEKQTEIDNYCKENIKECDCKDAYVNVPEYEAVAPEIIPTDCSLKEHSKLIGAWQGSSMAFGDNNQTNQDWQDEYNKQNYNNCYVNVAPAVIEHNVETPATVYTTEDKGYTNQTIIIPAIRNITAIRKDNGCQTAVYYITQENDSDEIHFQCKQNQSNGIITYKKDTLNKNKACDAIKSFYKSLQR